MKEMESQRNEGAQFPGAGNYHFHPALELSLAGLAAPATGTSESVVVAAGWTGNGSSSVAQPGQHQKGGNSERGSTNQAIHGKI